MPDYEVVIEVVSRHIIRVNHPNKEWALSDARDIAIRHTEGTLLRLTPKSVRRVKLVNAGVGKHIVDIGGKGIGGSGNPNF